jgi:hypothetical protein
LHLLEFILSKKEKIKFAAELPVAQRWAVIAYCPLLASYLAYSWTLKIRQYVLPKRP